MQLVQLPYEFRLFRAFRFINDNPNTIITLRALTDITEEDTDLLQLKADEVSSELKIKTA